MHQYDTGDIINIHIITIQMSTINKRRQDNDIFIFQHIKMF